MVLFWMSEVCSCINLLIYFGHHLSEVQNDHGDNTSLGSVHYQLLWRSCIQLTDWMLQENAEQRIWFEERLPFSQSQKKYFKLLSEDMTYPQSIGSCPPTECQMENPIIEI
jgi:hypothetical protein